MFEEKTVNVVKCLWDSFFKDLYMFHNVKWKLPSRFSECGGKMHLREGEYEKAHTDFFEAFKNYDESGSPR